MSAKNRRQWIREVAAAPLTLPLAAAPAAPAPQDYQLFWGDLHNHNAVGYARGTIERTYDIARSHLDFVAFTPHAQWPDMPEMPGNAHMKWVNGFQVLRENWDKVQKLAAAHNERGKFVAFVAYEWHSSAFGDYCIYFPGDKAPFAELDHVRKLQDHARQTNAIIVPHHIAYKEGLRGANFSYFDPTVSPVIEIYSEHGLSESDNGPHDYITHSMGGRWTRNTLREILSRGVRAGVIASSDDHLGYPGAYGEGLVGIYARDLSRESLLEAIRERRTIAATGDRIALAFRINGKWGGSTLPFTSSRTLSVAVDARDEVDRVEIVKNDRVIHRMFPEDHAMRRRQWTGEALCRLEFGWGPWGMLDMTRVCDWEISASIEGGKLRAAHPCFQSGPFDERRRNRIVERGENSVRIVSYTSRADAHAQRATNSVVLHVSGGEDAVLEVSLAKPAVRKYRKTLRELARYNDLEITGPFQSETILIHRLVTPEFFRLSYEVPDQGRRGTTDWYYARVCQANGHQAWSSPIWVEG